MHPVIGRDRPTQTSLKKQRLLLTLSLSLNQRRANTSSSRKSQTQERRGNVCSVILSNSSVSILFYYLEGHFTISKDSDLVSLRSGLIGILRTCQKTLLSHHSQEPLHSSQFQTTEWGGAQKSIPSPWNQSPTSALWVLRRPLSLTFHFPKTLKWVF